MTTGITGKTTLAIQVGKQLLNQFDHVIYVKVSSSPNVKKFQDDIAAPLGLKWEDCTESVRPGKLWSRLTNGQKILMILDDVWDWRHDSFEEIGIPCNENHKGCKLLITTRKLHVCNLMGCKRIIQIDVLSSDDSWIMFKTHAEVADCSSKSLLDKAREIAKECKGLPVAIAVIARSLRGQHRLDEWDAALNSLKRSLFSMLHVDENSVEIYKCLKYSYDNMKHGKDKRMFLLFSVLKEVPADQLIIFGIGVGLFGEIGDKYHDARNQVVVTIND